MLSLIRWIKVLNEKIKNDHISAYSAMSVFFILLSAMPFVMLLLILIRHLPIDNLNLTDTIASLLPGSNEFITNILVELQGKASGTVLSLTIITLLWSAGKGILAITRGLNAVHGLEETRHYIILRIIATLYTLIFAVMIVFTLVFLVFGNQIYLWICQVFPILNDVAGFIISIRTIASLAILTGLFLFFFMVLPNKKCKLSHELPGAVFTALGWMISSYIFSIYIDFSSNLSYVYGSLAGVIVLMLWLYFCMNLMFFGVELNVLLFPDAPPKSELKY